MAADLLGHEELRAGQREAIESVLAGRDTLAVMPTGSGKSAIYQVAGASGMAPVLVVSPLIALQQDQVASIEDLGIGPVSEINSSMPASRRSAALQQLASGELRFALLSPEQLSNEETFAAASASRTGLLVVDEAHCVSSWGHDFRPEYLHLGRVADELGRPPILALTATASPPVREEIVERLGMVDPAVIVRGFDRPNIHLSVETHHDPEVKLESLVEMVKSTAGAKGIVYVATRRESEEICERLSSVGIRAGAYHAGMGAGARGDTYEHFMGDTLDVIVATTAFGMGIDKSDVRFVAHFEVSDSVDSYYQEVGRCGRDGAPARAVLYYRAEDLGLRRFFAGGADADHEALEEAATHLAECERPATAEELSEATGRPERDVLAALQRLAEAGWAAQDKEGRFTVTAADDHPRAREAADEAERAQDAHRNLQKTRVEMMRAYAETRNCRRQFILTYFGEPFEPPCGNCDNCDAGRSSASPARDSRWHAEQRVRHREWGVGTVLRVDGDDRMTVLFDDAGYRTLSPSLVEESGVLQPLHS